MLLVPEGREASLLEVAFSCAGQRGREDLLTVAKGVIAESEVSDGLLEEFREAIDALRKGIEEFE